MPNRIERSIEEPIRKNLTWQEAWEGPDKGIIFCWEKGRRERLERPDDAARKGQIREEPAATRALVPIVPPTADTRSNFRFSFAIH
jgi:hypothetical protein